MLEKLPIDNLLQILGYLKMRDLASVDRSSPALGFACAQIFLRNKKYQTRLLFLNSVLPHIKFGEKWSSPARINALKKISSRRQKSTPFELPKNERVLEEQRRKKKLANDVLGSLLLERPLEKQVLMEQLMGCRHGEENKKVDETILQVWRLLLESFDDEGDACEWVDDALVFYDFDEEFSDSD
ncbi:hypothetical protein A9K97_gp140 [Tokyovirus A1]|uniref:hypothetical protein n=1 Tax=Tokyovirus A1 TaxID=1826170 RepID=UPI0007A965FF|nr:hypothetical protein A9K97_gp140 [Tokyovirus A1]BAU80211.1 hypothetical protein [Tokyovirus A1]